MTAHTFATIRAIAEKAVAEWKETKPAHAIWHLSAFQVAEVMRTISETGESGWVVCFSYVSPDSPFSTFFYEAFRKECADNVEVILEW